MPSTAVTTLPERKSAEAARRKRAAQQAVRALQEYARSHGGRFVIFGSYATDTMRFDSDLDVMIDFPADAVGDAWRFAEDVCAGLAIPLDIHDAGMTKPEFLERVRRNGLVLA